MGIWVLLAAVGLADPGAVGPAPIPAPITVPSPVPAALAPAPVPAPLSAADPTEPSEPAPAPLLPMAPAVTAKPPVLPRNPREGAQAQEAEDIPRWRLQLMAGAAIGFLTGPHSPAHFADTFVRGSGTAGIAGFFGRPLRLDGRTPLSLQPFLQRVSVWSFEAGGIGISSIGGNPDYGRIGAGGARLSVNAYLTPRFELFGSFGFGVRPFLTLTEFTSETRYVTYLPMSLGFGLWVAKTLLRLGYEISPYVEGGKLRGLPFFGGVIFSARTVLETRTSLLGALRGLDGGVAVRIELAHYFSQRFGLFGAVEPSYGALQSYDDLSPLRFRISGEIGVSYWFSPSLKQPIGVSFSAQPRWSAAVGGPPGIGANGDPWNFQADFVLSIFARLREIGEL